MKFSVTSYNAVAVWKWDTHPNSSDHKLYHYATPADVEDSYAVDEYDDEEDDEEDDVCGICRLAFESTCPECKIPGDDCPLIWGECTHVFHMHCLLKWIDTESSKGQCPLDRRPWATADRAPDRLPTTTTGDPVATVVPGPPGSAPADADSHLIVLPVASSPVHPTVRFEERPTTRVVEAEAGGEAGDEWDIGEEGEGEEEDGMDVDEVEHPSSLRI